MKTNNSFGCRFLSVFLCLSMLLAPVVALADAIPASQILKDSVMSADEAVTIVEGGKLTTPLYRLVEDPNEISGDKKYVFLSTKDKGQNAVFLKYADTLAWSGTSGEAIYSLPVDIVDGDTVFPAGLYVSAPSGQAAYDVYEWYIENTTGVIYTPTEIRDYFHWKTSADHFSQAAKSPADGSDGTFFRFYRNSNSNEIDKRYEIRANADVKGLTDAHKYVSFPIRITDKTMAESAYIWFINEAGERIGTITIKPSDVPAVNTWYNLVYPLNGTNAEDIYKIQFVPFGTDASKETTRKNTEIGYLGFFTSEDEAESYYSSHPVSAASIIKPADIATSRAGDRVATTGYKEFTRFTDNQTTLYKEYFKFFPYVDSSTSRYLTVRYRTNMPQTSGIHLYGFASYGQTPNSANLGADMKYNNDGKWHTAVFNVSSLIGTDFEVIRLEFSRAGATQDLAGYYFDIATMGYFNTRAEAQAFGDSIIPAEAVFTGSERAADTSAGLHDVVLTTKGNAAKIETVGFDPFVHIEGWVLPSTANKGNLKYAVVRYRTSEPNNSKFTFYYNVASGQDKSVSGNWITDGQWHSAIVDFSAEAMTSNTSYIRFDPFDQGGANTGNALDSGCSIDIASIAFFANKADAQTYASTASIIANNDPQKFTYTVNSVKDETKYLYGDYIDVSQNNGTNTKQVKVKVGTSAVPCFLPAVDGGYLKVTDEGKQINATIEDSAGGISFIVYEKVAEKDYTIPAVKAWLIDGEGSVAKGAATSTPTGAYLKVMAGDEVYDVPVTVDMLTKADGTAVSTGTDTTLTNLTVTYEGVKIYEKFTLNIASATTLVSGNGFYKLVTPLDPDGEVTKSLKNNTNYMLIDSAESGYGKSVSLQFLVENHEGIKATPAYIYEVEIDGEKQYIASPPENNRNVWKASIASQDHSYSSELSSKYGYSGPFFVFETQGVYEDANKNIKDITGYLRYDNNGSSIHTVKWDPSAVPNSSTLKLGKSVPTASADAAGRAGYLWCEMPATSISFTHRSDKTLTATISQGTGLACYAQAKVYGNGDTSTGTLSGNIGTFTKNLNEWRGMHFANEISNFTTRVPVDAYVTEDKGVEIELGISNMTVYDRIYYYEEDTSIKSITAHVDKTDIAIQHGAAGADLTGANIVITTTKTGGSVSVSTVPITMDMLSIKDSNGQTAVSTTSSADANKTYNDLQVTYQDVNVGKLNLTVAAETGDPVYPNPGSVVITKELDTSTHDYWGTGTARLELSVTGVPTSSGADVVIAIDNSGSMQVDIGGKTRREAITDAIEAALTVFANSKEDIAVSIVTFDGYDLIDGGYVLNRTRDTVNKVDTNCDSNLEPDTAQFLTSGFNQYIPDVDDRFVEHDELTSTQIKQIIGNYKYTGAGTNYDRGLELAYETLNARQKQNALNGTKRDSYLILMGDGETLQFNYMGLCSNANEDYKDELLLGHLDDAGLVHDSAKPNEIQPDLSSKLPKDLYDVDGDGNTTERHPYYDTHYNKLGESWMAEAIKGSVDKKYMVIDPDANPTDKYLDYVNGLGATVYTIGVGMFDTNVTNAYMNDYIPNKITSYKSGAEVLRKISSDWSHDDVYARYSSIVGEGKVQYWNAIYKDNKHAYFVTDDVGAINKVFTDIAGSISVLSEAVFTDTMSDYVELQTKKQNEFAKDPKITVTEYQTYKYSEIGTVVGGVYVSAEQVGKIKPGTTANVKETVTFTTANGKLTAAYSNKKGSTTNILANNKITAQYFTYDLTSETFKWNIGEIPENKYVLAFDVYLIGSMEGARDDGTYPTNKDTSTKTGAYLTYTNFEGNAREIQVPTPYLPWGDAQVSVAYYLVDDKGRPITHLGGSPVSFDLAYKVTTPEIFTSFALNSETGKITAENLPQGLSLYDTAASYEVKATSDNGGAWKITSGEGKTKSTYVTQYSSGSNTATNEQRVYTDLSVTDEFIAEGDFESKAGYTYSNTVVWFAVTSPISASPETVVIDYGLPVDINITANDIGGFKATAITSQTLPVVTEYEGASITVYQSTEADYETDYKKYFDDSLTNGEETDGEEGAIGLYGKAELTDDDFVKYTPTGMEMDGKDVFTYALQFENGTPSYAVGMDYLFRKLTVVPATSIYYEEKFVEFETYNSTLQSGVKTPAANAWENVSNINGATGSDNINGYPQAQDRPGVEETIFDVGNIYGYDGQYTNCATFSLGNSKKITVDESITGEAKFTFKGTGFDIIGLTNNNTGTVVVQVYKGVPTVNDKNLITDKAVKTLLVDTYYGYTYEKQSDNSYKWVINADASETLYQVPVISIENLDYDEYTAVVTVSYSEYLDNRYDENGDNSYDFYFDAVRIYNPANNGANDSVIKDAYIKDNECWPMYTELRGTLIAAKEVLDYAASETEAAKVGGSMFIDGCPTIDKNATGYDQWVNVDYFHGRYTYERNQFDDDANNDPTGAIKNYMNYGPNNEVYLAPGQAISFTLGASYQGSDMTDEEKEALEKLLADYTASVHVAIKAAKGTPIINMYAVGTPAEGSEKKYEFTKGLMETTINNATELYYDITALDGMTVVIMNSAQANSDNILSITNVKRTFTKDPAELIQQVSETATVEKTSAVYINRQTVELALASLEMESDSAATFEPDTFDVSVSKSSVKEGKTVTVTVKTSSDVDSITVNGETVTKYRRSLFTKQRTWTYTVKATEAGELPIEVVAYNADGEFSEPVTETVEVTSNSSTGGSSSSSWFDKWFGGLFGKK